MKTCNDCGNEFPLEDFPFKNKAKGYRHAVCIGCKREREKTYRKTYVTNNPEKRKATEQAYNRSTAKLGSNRRWRFGLAPETIEAMIEAQGGVCGLCRRDFSNNQTFVDHDHACCPGRTKTCGKCVRMILCRSCNQGLGFFLDSPELLREAADYIERHRRSR